MKKSIYTVDQIDALLSGKGIAILGRYDSTDDITDPVEGGHYYIGTEEPYDVYTYVNGAWVNAGPLAIPGPAFTYDDFTPEQLAALQGKDGKSPYIDASTNNWMVWDDQNGVFVDTGIPATNAGFVADAKAYAESAAGSADSASKSSSAAGGSAAAANQAASNASGSAAQAAGSEGESLNYLNQTKEIFSNVQMSESNANAAALAAQAEAKDAGRFAENAKKSAANAGKPPYIGENGNWFVWSIDEAVFIDSGIAAKGDAPIRGEDYWTEEDKTEVVEEAAVLVKAWIYPEDYGAAADGVTDDSAAIQAAIDAGATKSMPVYLGKKNYKISTGVFIRNNYDIFRCDGTITYDGEGAAVTLTGLLRAVVDINSIHAENGTAIKLDTAEGRVTFCHVNVNNIRSSKIGIHLTTTNTENPEGAPIYYNKIYYSDIVATEVGIFVEPVTYMINENWYFGGTVGSALGENMEGGCKCAIKIKTGEEYGSGANKFITGGIEGVATDGTAIYLENTSDNIFRNIRSYELKGRTMVKFKGNCTNNDIEMGSIRLNQIDTSELGDIGNQYNVLRSQSMSATGATLVGREARVSKFGITYKPDMSNSTAYFADDFTDDVIKPLDGVTIPTIVKFTREAVNGKTFMLHELYSEPGSLARGYPITFVFGQSGTDSGRVKVVDALGTTVVDNLNGHYAGGTSVTAQCVGYTDWGGEMNNWIVKPFKEVLATEKTAKTIAESVAGEMIAAHNQSVVAHTDIRNQASAAMSRLPAEYQAVVSITADGNQFFDSGILASDYPEGLVYEFEGVINGVDADVAEYLFGALSSGKRSGNVAITDERGQLEVVVGASPLLRAVPYTIGEKFKLVLKCSALTPEDTLMYFNGEICEDTGIVPNASEMPSVNIHLLRVNGSSATKYAMVTICRYAMRKPDGTPIRYFVPCYRKSDGEIGLYDTVACEFHESLGTGSCTKGADDNSVAVYPYSLADLQTIAENAILGGEW